MSLHFLSHFPFVISKPKLAREVACYLVSCSFLSPHSVAYVLSDRVTLFLMVVFSFYRRYTLKQGYRLHDGSVKKLNATLPLASFSYFETAMLRLFSFSLCRSRLFYHSHSGCPFGQRLFFFLIKMSQIVGADMISLTY